MKNLCSHSEDRDLIETAAVNLYDRRYLTVSRLHDRLSFPTILLSLHCRHQFALQQRDNCLD